MTDQQLCILCGDPTGRCKEDELVLEPIIDEQGNVYGDDIRPVCEVCFDERTKERNP